MADVDTRVVLNHGELHRLGQHHAGRLVLRTTAAVLARAKATAPVRTGRLRASLESRIVRSRGEVVGEVSSPLNYMSYVHEGTRRHVIRPRRARALRFPMPAGSSSIVFAMRVDHPGTRANPFLRQAMEDVARGVGFIVR